MLIELIRILDIAILTVFFKFNVQSFGVCNLVFSSFIFARIHYIDEKSQRLLQDHKRPFKKKNTVHLNFIKKTSIMI